MSPACILLFSVTCKRAGYDFIVEGVLLACQNSEIADLVVVGVSFLPLANGLRRNLLILSSIPSFFSDSNITSIWSSSVKSKSTINSFTSFARRLLCLHVFGDNIDDSL